MKIFQNDSIKLQKIEIKLCLIISALVFITKGWEWGLSFMIGGVLASVYIYLLIRQIKKLSSINPGKAKKSAIQNLFFRYMIVLVILIFASRLKFINLFMVISGLMLVPVSSVLTAYAIRRDEKER